MCIFLRLLEKFGFALCAFRKWKPNVKNLNVQRSVIIYFSTLYLFYVHPVVGIARTCFGSASGFASGSWIRAVAEIRV